MKFEHLICVWLRLLLYFYHVKFDNENIMFENFTSTALAHRKQAWAHSSESSVEMGKYAHCTWQLGNCNECSLRICNQLQSCNPILNFVVGRRSRRIGNPLLLHLCGSIHFYENIRLVWIGQPRFPGGGQRNAKIEFFRPLF